MNAREEGIISTLKDIAKMEDIMAKEAMEDGEHMFTIHALTIAKITTDAAEIIEKQSKEIDELKTRSLMPNKEISDIGRQILIIPHSQLNYIIVAELPTQYLVMPAHMKELSFVEDLRLIERTQAVFVDTAAGTALNA